VLLLLLLIRGHSQRRQRYHHVPVVVDNRLYDLRLTDCPTISQFPASSLQEWAEYRGYGLRHASAYILVYDVSDDDSFSYVRFMREQILTYRGAHSQHDVPIIVAANKADLQASALVSRSGLVFRPTQPFVWSRPGYPHPGYDREKVLFWGIYVDLSVRQS